MYMLLIQPPVEDFYETEVRLQPIGLAYLKAVLGIHLPSVRVRIVDFHRGWGRRTVPLPTDLRDLRTLYGPSDRGPFRTFHSYYRFGASFEQMVDFIRKEAPDVVGISSLFTAYFREALETAAAARQACGAVTILGGAHPSAVPASVLGCADVDYVVRGEGERPLVELMRILQRDSRPTPEALASVNGLGFKTGCEIRLNPLGPNYPIETLPFPDLSDLRQESYAVRGRSMTFLVSSRGCPHHCTFCSIHSTFPEGHRIRPVEDVMAEVRARVAQGFRVIDFEDDNLTHQRDRMKRLCRELKEELAGRDVELVAMNGVSYWSLDPELLRLMKEAGFTRLNVSLVTSDRTVLEATRRPHAREHLDLILGEAVRLEMRVTCYQILGLPGDGLDGMIQTMAFLAARPVEIGASPLYAAPGSPIAGQIGRGTSERDFVRCRLTAMGTEAGQESQRQIFTLFVCARILNFMKQLPVPCREVADCSALESRNLSAIQQQGLQLLERLRRERKLSAITASGFQEVENFQSQVFFRLCRETGRLATLSGGWIDLSGIAQ